MKVYQSRTEWHWVAKMQIMEMNQTVLKPK
jgi:hypothetical protein